MTTPAVSTPTLREIPAGSFVMGAGDDDRFATFLERPRHTVTFARPFSLATTPVTFSQWDAYADESDAPRPPDYGAGRGDLPVTSVSYREVHSYLDWLRDRTGTAYRLPTEAEWEYSCRAGTDTVFQTGDDLPLEAANYWYSEDGKKIGPGHPKPVASYPPNPFGIHDLHGTVNEFVADAWHEGYDHLPADGSAHVDPAAPYVVTRGGAWDLAPRLLRSAHRDWISRDQRLDNVGFRLAVSSKS